MWLSTWLPCELYYILDYYVNAVSAQSPFIHCMSYLADNQKTPGIRENQPEKKKRNNETKFPISGLKSERVICVMTVEVDSLNNESRNTRTKQTLNYPWNSTSLNERWKPVDLSSYFLVIFGSCFIQFSVSFAASRINIAVQLMTRNRQITRCCRKNYFVHLSI